MIECKNLGVLFYIGFVCLFTFILLPLLPNNECIAFNKSLSLKQLQYYKKIKSERLKHFIYGCLIGLISASFIVVLLQPMNKYESIGLFSIITIVGIEITYMLLPKSDYMLYHLTNTNQQQLLINCYNKWITNAYYSFTLIGIATICFYVFACKN